MFKTMKTHIQPFYLNTGVGYFRKGLLWLLVVISGVVAAWLIANHRYSPLLLASVAVPCILIGLYNWRWSTYALLAYLPFAGIPILTMYPSKFPLLFKDFFFVIPAYIGFVGTYVLRREPIRFSGLPLWLIGAFGALVFVQLFNPNLNNWLVGLIGLKVWLLYMPLCILAYHLVNTREGLTRLVRIVLLISLIPFLFGILQAILVYRGYDHLAYMLYGNRAAAVSQNFAQFGFLGGGFLRRLPSVFQSTTQYYGYVISMLPLAAAVWMIKKSGTRNHLGIFLVVLVSLAGFLSGIRRAFLLIPAFWLLFSLFLAKVSNITRSMIVIVIAILVTLNILGTHLSALYEPIGELTVHYSRTTVAGDFIDAIKTAPLGRGTGMDTNPARYGLADSSAFRWLSENYYAKAVYELGIVGFVILVVLFLTILRKGWSGYRVLRDPVLRTFSAAFLAYFAVIMIDCTKAQPLDIDPLNVYFWVFAGLSAKLISLDLAHTQAN